MSIRSAVLPAAICVVALAGCGDSAGGPETRATPSPTTARSTAPAASGWNRGYPNSIAVLGHSGSTGANSDPTRPGRDVRENSWATGINPEVRSVYGRILAHNPAIKGHNLSYSQGGAGITMVAAQADRLLATDPDTALILIQVMDNDLTCPLDRSALGRFQQQLHDVLNRLAGTTSTTRLFVVSQIGSVRTYADALTRAERAAQGGTGPCDFMTPSGDIDAAKVRRLEHAIHAYEAALEVACKRVPRCTYDQGDFGRIADRHANLSDDLNHFNVAGHAELAAVAWATLQRTGVLPREP